MIEENQNAPVEHEVVEASTEEQQDNAPAAQAETAEKSESAPETNDESDRPHRAKGAERRIHRLTNERAEYKAKAELLEQELIRLQGVRTETNSQDGKPVLEHYKTPEEFIEAMTEWKLEQRESKAKAVTEQSRKQEFDKKVDSLFEKAKVDREEFAENVPVLSKGMADAIIESDVGDLLVKHLNSHPDDAHRIANLSPARQIAEIGKLEEKLSSPAKASKASPPIKPLGASGSTQVLKDLGKMSHEEYRELRAKQGARWAR